jgi:hypothetical protein
VSWGDDFFSNQEVWQGSTLPLASEVRCPYLGWLSSHIRRFVLWGVICFADHYQWHDSDRRLPDCHANNVFLAPTWFGGPEATSFSLMACRW